MASQAKHPSKRGRPAKEGLRDHLLDHTLTVLLAVGFQSFSMSAVAKSANASKESLYKHFGDRSGLLLAALERQASRIESMLLKDLDAVPEPTQRLRRLALNYLEGCYSPRAIALQRIAHTGGADGLGPMFTEKFTDTALAIISAEFGRMATPQPDLDAEIFLGMIRGMLHERTLLGAKTPSFTRRRDAIVDHAVEIFSDYLAQHRPARRPGR